MSCTLIYTYWPLCLLVCFQVIMYLIGFFVTACLFGDYKSIPAVFYIWSSLPTPSSLSLSLNRQSVVVVDCFKYRGTHFDNKLSFSHNTAQVHMKAAQHLYLLVLRKLRSLNVSAELSVRPYHCLVWPHFC